MNLHSTPPNSVPPPPPFSGRSSDERLWGMLGHLSALSGLMTCGVGNIVGPLIVWQAKKDSLPFAAAEAKEALNFNISWLLWGLVLGCVTAVLMLVLIGFLLLPILYLLGLVWLVLTIIAGIKAHEGRSYRYPLTIRFIS